MRVLGPRRRRARKAVTLVFTTVLDRTTLGVEENEEPDEPRDRHYWETRASHDTIALMDGLLGLVREVEPGANLKYNKNYIGIVRGGVVSNFVSFRPRRQHVLMELKIPGPTNCLNAFKKLA